MRRFKILAGTTSLIIALIAILALSVNKNESSSDSDITGATLAQKKTVDPDVVRKNKALQQELVVAVSTYFKKAIKSGDIIGAGVSIVKGDSILLSDGYGKRSVDTKEKVDAETVFRLGSLSKGFTGVLAADLKADGKLDWNDKVTEYIPEFQLGDVSNTGKIRLSHILSHTSGTPYHSFTNLVEAGLPMSKIAGRFDEVKPISAPGEMYSYQNAMFALSSEVMKKATGKEISQLLQNRFFKPLGMQTANTDYETLIAQENIAIPHSKRRNYWKSRKLTDHYDNAVAAGGVNASALDMAKWMRFLLGNNPEILDEESLSEAFEPQVEINIGRKYYKKWPGHKVSHYAFGWRIHTFENEATQDEMIMWHHGGSVNSFRNEIAILPEADLGICVLLNSNSKLARNVIPDLHEIVTEVYSKTSQKLLQTPETVSNSFE